MTGSDMLKIGAPFIAMGGVWVVRRAISGGYRAATGNNPPAADDLDVPMTRVIIFAAGVAVAAAVINVAVTRGVARAAAAQHREDPLVEA